MNTSIPTPSREETSQGATPLTLGVLVVYDTIASGLRAMRACQKLKAAFDAENAISLKPNLWKAAALNDSLFRAIAAQEAIDADVVLIALEGRLPLPERVASWMEMWIAKKANRPAALAFLWSPHHRASAARIETALRLRRYAAIGGMDYVSEGDQWSASASKPPPRTAARPRDNSPSTAADPLRGVKTPTRFYGIND